MSDDPTIALAALVVSVGSFAFSVLKGRYDQIVGVKPALVFVYGAKNGWELHNIGAGPALNIVVAQLDPRSEPRFWKRPIRIPPLKKDGTFEIHWDPKNNTERFGAIYEDMWSRKYTTVCQRDLNRIRRGWHLGMWKEDEITAEWSLRS